MKEAYTNTNTKTSYYQLPEDCIELLEVKSLRYSGQYENIDFIKIYKGDTFVGFSLYKIYDESIPRSIMINYN